MIAWDGAQYTTEANLTNAGVSVQIKKPSSLDDPAIGALSYRDIFITGNKAPNGSFTDGTYSGWTVNAGAPEISDEVYHTPG